MSEPVTCTQGWISDLADAVSRLDAEQLRVLASNFKGETCPSIPTIARLQRILSLSTTDASHLARSLKRILSTANISGHDVSIVLVVLAQTRSAARIKQKSEKVEMVCTGSSGLGVPVRGTYATAIEMVKAAHREIFVVGYVFTEGARGLLKQLAVAYRDRGVRVTLVGNRMYDHLAAIRSIWPANVPGPNVFSRETGSHDDITALHAKLLICDSISALITSANFSYHGLHENIEIGVKVHSPVVARLVELVQAMIAREVVKKLNWFI